MPITTKSTLKIEYLGLDQKYLRSQRFPAFDPGSLDPLFLSHLGRFIDQLNKNFVLTQKSQVNFQVKTSAFVQPVQCPVGTAMKYSPLTGLKGLYPSLLGKPKWTSTHSSFSLSMGGYVLYLMTQHHGCC